MTNHMQSTVFRYTYVFIQIRTFCSPYDCTPYLPKHVNKPCTVHIGTYYIIDLMHYCGSTVMSPRFSYKSIHTYSHVYMYSYMQSVFHPTSHVRNKQTPGAYIYICTGTPTYASVYTASRGVSSLLDEIPCSV